MMQNKSPAVTLISHASVIIEMGEVVLLTDPWQFGTAFNDSWKLLIEPADLTQHLDRITHIWISHEHPDHFHIPTLRSLPETFRKRVTILFQQSSDCEKMVRAFNSMLGCPNVRLMPHRRWLDLTPDVQAYCYHSRQIDSALALRSQGVTVLNLNDCEASENDLHRIGADLGPVDLLLNQFSIAGFDGNEKRLAKQSAEILDTMVRDHRVLDAKATVPFASFIYFCCPDNAKINAYANSPRDVAARFASESLSSVILAPGDRHVIGDATDNTSALSHFANAYSNIDLRDMINPQSIAFDSIETAFASQRKKLVAMHGQWALRFLRPVHVRIPDLAITVRMAFRDGTFDRSEAAPDIEIHSQPLHFMLSNAFGSQTLGVSGRYRLHGDLGNWFRHRMLFSMMNAGIGFAARQLFSARQFKFFWRRRGDIIDQLRYRVSRALRPTDSSSETL